MESSMQATAIARANIALSKYWGKRQVALNLPAVGSISITLDALSTKTTVAFDPSLERDVFTINGEEVVRDAERVSRFLELVRSQAGMDVRARITTDNNFPTGAGLASSASGFAALSVAATHAAGLRLTPAEQSALARQGSASAARSLFGGFVEMFRGEKDDGSDSHAVELAPAEHWPLSVAVAITSRERKAIGSTEAMMLSADTSPYYDAWVESSKSDVIHIRDAIMARDFAALAEASEFSCLKMHGLMLATNPGLVYWNATTVDLIHRVRALRGDGVPVFFTIDAGPQVKAVCPSEHLALVTRELAAVDGVCDIIESQLGSGAALIEAP